MRGFLHFCLSFSIMTSAVFSQTTNIQNLTMSQMYLNLDSSENKDLAISDEIRNAFESSGITDDLYLTLNPSDLIAVNGEIMQLYEQQKIKRHHIEFNNNLSLDLNEIPKYGLLLHSSGYSVTLKSSSDVIALFSILHTMENLRTVKLTLGFETTENLDSFYGTTLHEFPTNTVEQLSVDGFLPYSFLYNVIRAFIQQSPHLNRIILYNPFSTNGLQHFRTKYVSDVETLVQKPLTIYVRPRDKSVVEEHFGLVLLKSLSSEEESQFENEYPFYVKKMKKIRPDEGEL